MRKDSEYIGRRIFRRQGGRPKRTFVDVVRGDRQIVGVTEENEEDRERARRMICRGISKKSQVRKRKNENKKKS